MVTAFVIVAVAVVSVAGSLVAVVSWAMSACILVDAYFGLFGVGVLIDSCNHIANPLRRLAIELGAEVTVMESSDEGSDDLSFREVMNRVPHLGKMSDIATKELGRLLVDAV